MAEIKEPMSGPQEPDMESLRHEIGELRSKEMIEKMDRANPNLVSIDPDSLLEADLKVYEEFKRYQRGESNYTNLEAAMEKVQQAFQPGTSILGNSRIGLFAYLRNMANGIDGRRQLEERRSQAK